MTDKLPPHLAAMRKVKSGFKPPRPETVHTGSVSMAVDPDPLRPVPSDNVTRWLSLAQAAATISTAIPDRKDAEQAILKAALDGVLRLSCEVLVVKTLAGNAVFNVKRPGDEARLGERIDKAYKSRPFSNFNYEPRLGRLSWVSLAGGVRHVAQRLLVDAEGVAAFFADPVLSAPANAPAPVVNEQPTETTEPAKRRRGGPKPRFDWSALIGALLRKADLDAMDDIRSLADLERWAADWFRDNGGEIPSVSTIRERVSPIFDQFDRRRE